MSDIFISYARRNEADAIRLQKALRALGFGVWRDDALPAHRPYAEVIEERLKSAKAVVVLWSADAIQSEWVRAEADLARKRRTLVQATLDGTAAPMPFNQIQVADLRNWRDDGHPGWLKVQATLAELLQRPADPPDQPQAAPPAGVGRTPERIRIPVELQPVVMASGRDPKGLALAMNSEIAKAMASLPGLRILAAGQTHAEAPAFLVEGALQRVGEQLRLTVSLRSSPEHALEWSEHYDGAMAELFAFQERAAGAVASNVDTMVRAREI